MAILQKPTHIKCRNYRPLTAEEYALLRKRMNCLAIIAVLLGGLSLAGAIHFAFLPGIMEIWKNILVYGLLLFAMLIGVGIGWDWWNIKKDIDSGTVEIIMGTITDMVYGLKSPIDYWTIDEYHFPVKHALWISGLEGDNIVVEWVPKSQIIFHIGKVEIVEK